MQDYDVDFSALEHSMMRQSSLNASSPSSSRAASRRLRLQDENQTGLSRQLISNYVERLSSIPMDTDLRSAYLNSNTGRLTQVVQLRPHPHIR